MRLYLIRHGKAKRESPTGRDEDRPLTKRGRRQAEFLAERIASAHASPAMLIHSGLRRARETAEPLARALDLDPEIETVLGEDERPEPVLELIERRWAQGPLALVGHNPQLSDLAAMLGEVDRENASLRTGESVVFEGPAVFRGSGLRVIDRLRSPE